MSLTTEIVDAHVEMEALLWTQLEFLSALRRQVGLKYHPDPQPTLYEEEVNCS